MVSSIHTFTGRYVKNNGLPVQVLPELPKLLYNRKPGEVVEIEALEMAGAEQLDEVDWVSWPAIAPHGVCG